MDQSCMSGPKGPIVYSLIVNIILILYYSDPSNYKPTIMIECRVWQRVDHNSVSKFIKDAIDEKLLTPRNLDCEKM